MADENKPQKPQAEIELAKKWQEKVDTAKKHWEHRFERMRADQRFVRGYQWPNVTNPADVEASYVCNIAKRHINQRVSSVYAKNPTFVARRRKRLDYLLWDGDQRSLEDTALRVAQGTPMPGDMELLQDIESGNRQKKLLDRIGKTLEIVFRQQLDEPTPRFKERFKSTVRRSKVNGVAYVKLGYQRIMEHKPETLEKINDQSRQIAAMEALAKQVGEGQVFEHTAEMEQLRIGLQQLQNSEKIVAREGLVFNFPRSTKLILDPCTESVKGFIGCGWLAEEHEFKQAQLRQFFGIDPTNCTYTHYHRDEKGTIAQGTSDKKEPLGRAYEIYDLENQQCLWILDGYEGFLKAPGDPDIWTEQFHPYFALVLNELEDETDPFPESDVHDLRPMQMEHNRSREALRAHRIANRPAWLGAKGLLKQDEGKKLSNHDVAEYIELENFNPADEIDLDKKIKAKPTQPIDAAMYDTDPIFQDVLLVSGDQEANLGPTAGATATESTIAENSRVSGLSSETDEVDEFLSALARSAGQLLFLEMSADTVKRIAGQGATWPEFAREDIAEEIYLEVLAGSSGRPNRQLRVYAIERTGPILLQVPKIKPEKLARELVQGIDESADVEDWIDDGLPSITAMNAMSQPQTADPATAPEKQGPEGANKQQRPPDAQGGSQRVFPSPAGVQ